MKTREKDKPIQDVLRDIPTVAFDDHYYRTMMQAFRARLVDNGQNADAALVCAALTMMEEKAEWRAAYDRAQDELTALRRTLRERNAEIRRLKDALKAANKPQEARDA